jgi:hypothetical protein
VSGGRFTPNIQTGVDDCCGVQMISPFRMRCGPRTPTILPSTQTVFVQLPGTKLLLALFPTVCRVVVVQVSSASFAWIIHAIILKLLLHFMGMSAAVPFLEVLAYAGYVFVHVCISTVFGAAFGALFVVCVSFLYTRPSLLLCCGIACAWDAIVNTSSEKPFICDSLFLPKHNCNYPAVGLILCPK